MGIRNTYYLLRHGFSVANELGLIVSSPELGLCQFGLAERGREEIRRCTTAHGEELSSVVRIYSSDFLRTLQTSEIVAEAFEIPVETSPLLRERCFGDLEGASNAKYESVWRQDRVNASHCLNNVESVASVAGRMTELIRRIDAKESAKTFLIVSHGDPLQIMIAARSGMDLRLHRSVPPIGTGQLRRLG